MSQGQAGYSHQKSEVQRYYCPVCCAVHLSFTSHPPFIRQIHHAAQHPVELDRRQADAVEARILLDLKVGAAFTRLQTLILQGRVPQIEAEKSVVSYGQLNSWYLHPIWPLSLRPMSVSNPWLRRSKIHSGQELHSRKFLVYLSLVDTTGVPRQRRNKVQLETRSSIRPNSCGKPFRRNGELSGRCHEGHQQGH